MLLTIPQLQAEYGWTLRLAVRDNWHPLYPNVGTLRGLPHLGTVRIHATDGILAVFTAYGGRWFFEGHLLNFDGPVATEEVHPDDWDSLRRERRICAVDGRIAIRDTFKDEYWDAGHSRLDEIEQEVLALVGNGAVAPEDYVGTVAALRTARASGKRTGSRAPRTASRRAKLEAILAKI